MIHIIQPVQKKSIYSVSSMQELKQPPMFQALQAKDLLLFLAKSSVGIDSSKVQPHMQTSKRQGMSELVDTHHFTNWSLPASIHWLGISMD